MAFENVLADSLANSEGKALKLGGKFSINNQQEWELLKNALIDNPQLEVLDLSNNNISTCDFNQLYGCIDKLKNLKKLDLSNNNLDKNAIYLLQLLLAHLEYLDISANQIGSEGINFLADTLKNINNCPLKQLNISKLILNGEAATNIAKTIKACLELESLDISENKIELSAINDLVQLLQGYPHLKYLGLRNNTDPKSISDMMFIGSLSELLQNGGSLQQLDLRGNNLSYQDMQRLDSSKVITSCAAMIYKKRKVEPGASMGNTIINENYHFKIYKNKF